MFVAVEIVQELGVLHLFFIEFLVPLVAQFFQSQLMFLFGWAQFGLVDLEFSAVFFFYFLNLGVHIEVLTVKADVVMTDYFIDFSKFVLEDAEVVQVFLVYSDAFLYWIVQIFILF